MLIRISNIPVVENELWVITATPFGRGKIHLFHYQLLFHAASPVVAARVVYGVRGRLMYVFMETGTYTRTHAYMHIHASIHTYTIHTLTYIHTHTRKHVRMYLLMHIPTHNWLPCPFCVAWNLYSRIFMCFKLISLHTENHVQPHSDARDVPWATASRSGGRHRAIADPKHPSH